MPWCPKCGTEYREGFTECADCGRKLVTSRLSKWCPQCGREYKSRLFTLCPYCNQALVNDPKTKATGRSCDPLPEPPPEYVYEGEKRHIIGSAEYPSDKGFYLIDSEITDYRYIRGVLHRLREERIPFIIVEGYVAVHKKQLDRANELIGSDPETMAICGENDEDIYMGGLDETIKPPRLAVSKDDRSLEQMKKALRLGNIYYKTLGTAVFVGCDDLKAAKEVLQPLGLLLVCNDSEGELTLPAFNIPGAYSIDNTNRQNKQNQNGTEYHGGDMVVMGIAKRENDLSKIKQALERACIPYKIEGKGVFVTSNHMDEALEATKPYEDLLMIEAENRENIKPDTSRTMETIQPVTPETFNMQEAFEQEAKHKHKSDKEEHAMGEERKKKRGFFGRKDEQDW